MMENRKYILALMVILTVSIVKYYSTTVNQILYNDINATNFYLSVLCQILYYLIPSSLIILIFHGPKQITIELGIGKGFITGFIYSLIFTLPMLIGYLFLGHFNSDDSIIRKIIFCFKDGFREEIFYRAFLFGQLFKHAKWKFIYSVIVNAFVFGISHLYQAHNLLDSIGVFFITFSGAIWFAWIFKEWKYNLWLPIGMHFFMNLYWDLFHISDTAMGSLSHNVPRILTIVLSIIITLYVKKYNIFQSKKQLWKKSSH